MLSSLGGMLYSRDNEWIVALRRTQGNGTDTILKEGRSITVPTSAAMSMRSSEDLELAQGSHRSRRL